MSKTLIKYLCNQIKNKIYMNTLDPSNTKYSKNPNYICNPTTGTWLLRSGKIDHSLINPIIENKTVNLTQNILVKTAQNKATNITQNEAKNTTQNETIHIPQNEATNITQNKIIRKVQNQPTNITQNKIIRKVQNQTTNVTQNEICKVQNEATNITQIPKLCMSDEQSHIVSLFKNNESVRTIARAGSGKTTTIYFIGKECDDKLILVLTFNRRLSDATRQRLRFLGLKNTEIQTYHGFCTKYFGSCRNDFDMKSYVDKPPRKSKDIELQKFHLLLLDELQDMNDLYYTFIKNALKFFQKDIPLGLFGDPHQTILAFNGGNAKYLEQADEHWNRLFKKCQLSTTYRLPHKMTRVINKLICWQFSMVGDPFQMISIDKKHDPPVDYHWINIYKSACKLIKSYINIYGKENILILAPAINKNAAKNSPILTVMNNLRIDGIDMCTLTDETAIDDEIIGQKLLISTIHKQKGCEKKCVVFFGLDCSYYKYYGNKGTLRASLNLLYVALTRSYERLVIIGNNKHKYLPFWSKHNLKQLTQAGDLIIHGAPATTCDCEFMPSCSCPSNESKGITISVTDLLKYKPAYQLQQLIDQPHIQITSFEENQHLIQFNNKILMHNGLVEQVDAVYTIMIPIIAEFFQFKQIRRIKHILSNKSIHTHTHQQIYKHSQIAIKKQLQTLYQQIQSFHFIDLKSLLLIALNSFTQISIYLMCYESYEFPIYQIDHYNWVDPIAIQISVQRIIDFRHKLSNNSSNKYQTNPHRNFQVTCIHQKIKTSISIYAPIHDFINHQIILYKIKNNKPDTLDTCQLILHLWISTQNSGYLVYPNLATTTKIQILDPHKFHNFMLLWINEIFKQYYHFHLNEFNPIHTSK